MRILGSFILAGLLIATAGCRTDDSSKVSSEMAETPASSASPAAAPRPPKADAVDVRPLVVCFGDSLTAGYGAEDGASYPDFLQKDLDRDGFRYRVVNEGVSGNTTKDGLDRLVGVERMKAAVVLLEFGGNDGLRGFEVKTTRANLGKMIEGLQASGAKVVLAGITLPPDYGADYVSTFTASYPVLAKKYNVPVLPFLLNDVYGVDGMMQADRTHATEKGNEVVARNILPLVEPLLKK